EHVIRDRLGDRFEEMEGSGLDDLADEVEDAPVVDRRPQVVGRAGGAQIERQLDVDLERLRLGSFPVMVTVAAVEAHVREDDPVAHGGCLTMASAIRAARALARTSWTRTMSTPARIARTVVATVASTRSSGGRSTTRPRVDLR